MPDIKKPDANPIVSALLTALVINLGHLLINGQQRKFIYTLVTGIVVGIVGIILCGIPGLIFYVLNIIESYQTAERLQKGETIGENEYSYETFYKIMSKIDKTATFKGAAAPTPPSAPAA
jgi:hypothetical protein